jgi:hypothetical protein
MNGIEGPIDPQVISTWVGIVTGIVTLFAGLVAGLWAYTKFVIERGLLPPSQFSVDCNTVGRQGEKSVVEILLRLKNVGTSALIATNIRVDVRFLDESQEPVLFDHPQEAAYGRLRFPQSLKGELGRRSGPVAFRASEAGGDLDNGPREARDGRGILLLDYDTFVQAGVEQVYTFVTALPGTATFVLVWASFQYEHKPRPIEIKILKLSRRLGLLHYSLANVTKPHTVERVFEVTSGLGRSSTVVRRNVWDA